MNRVPLDPGALHHDVRVAADDPSASPAGPCARDRLSVLVAEDHPVYREALVEALASRPTIDVVVAVARGRDAVRELRARAVDVVLLDLRLPDMDGLAVLRQMRLDEVPTRAVVLSNECATGIVRSAIGSGAIGYLTKSAQRSTICAAVEAAAADRATFDDVTMATLAAAVRAADPGLDALGRRERRIVELTARGIPSAEVAEHLGLTASELHRGVGAICAALVGDRTEPVDPGPGPVPSRPRKPERARSDGPGHALTERELEVLDHLPGPMSAAQIASELFVSPNTVRTHIKSIHRKLVVTNRNDAVRRARDTGLIPPVA